MNYTYMLLCSDGTLYTGWTNCLERRLSAHNSGKGSKYTRARLPVKLVWCMSFESKKEAMSMEYRVKQLPREKKLKLAEEYSRKAPAV